MKWPILSACVLFAFASILQADAKFALSDKGVVIQAGAMGNFSIDAPILRVGKGEEKPVFAKKDANSAVADYACGLKLNFEVKADQINFHLTNGPKEAKNLKFTMMVPMKYNQGGKFAFDGAEFKPFPLEKGEQHVQHGNFKTFTLIDPSNLGFTLETPGGYTGVTDNRHWNWHIFGYNYQFDFGGREDVYFNIALKQVQGQASSEPAKPLVDQFGQSTRKDWPGKVKSEAELKEDGKKQLEEIASFKADPKFDTHGGLVGSGEQYKLKKTGFFHIETVNNRQVLVSPEGNLFFQLGVCGIARTDDDTLVKGRESVFEWLPPKDGKFKSAWRDGNPGSGVMSFYVANWIRKFDKPWTLDEWTNQVMLRMKSWGFNSAGAFSSRTESQRNANFPWVSFLPLKGDGVKVLPDKIGADDVMDPFAEGTEEALDKKFSKGVASNANDPSLIGYFLGNEQHFEILPKLIPTYKASKVAAKGRLVQMLQEKYKEISAFNKAWNPVEPFANFDDLKETSLFIRTDAANADMLEFYQLYLETYYSMVRRVFDRHDKNHLLIGSRWTPGTANNKWAVTIGGKYIDVVSINYYGYFIEEAFLKKVYDWSGGKPMIFSEWYYSTPTHGLGSHVEVRSEKERGMAYRNYVEQSAALPFVVGSQWFIYTDQAITGRFFQGFHGEGNNTGFVDVTDRPYTELVDAAKLTHARIYDVMMGKEKPFSFDDSRFNGKVSKLANKSVTVPRAMPDMKLNGTTSNWPTRPTEPIDSSRLVLGPPNPNLRGDFRLCWDEQNLYFHIQVKDATPFKSNKKGGSLWSADAVELFIGPSSLDQKGNMMFSDRQILIRATENPEVFIVDHPEDSAKCQVITVKDVAGDGYALQIAIQWSALGASPKAGMDMLFDVSIDNSDDGDSRKNQLAWNGTGQNSKDRGAWGRAKIVDN